MVLLNIITCGWYYIYWIYQTSSEIKNFTKKENLNPIIEVLLGIVTGGLYFKYWYYKYGNIVYKEMPLKVGMSNTENKTMVLVIIDLIVAFIYFFNLIINIIILLIALNNPPINEEELIIFVRLLPTSLLFMINISSLIMQNKLNNIWKKAE
ncbi:DUF4234 domain-containing protein [Brachyspira hyodysenteriae]|uniref:DUF4234 domain-containing protein n=1 Tax=Brachyspira hyodysenteriae TaxID=159 RepID=UPI0022CD6167|nr:DUF4234 domain-containing protein [Brachyspira hyodysenteriae]MCZ9838409.1 DUF4234 domain-containing protein [Brachyspira hyodysenteriae]MCZ9849522.1 DUF4234 domain-containing protein [Brachyspira hyodysenteriae]MCZ9850123.1 DUF4234 domain-containing protein [Brachyspira hyodysenteriae]MCZ9861054.1 DUF4234 domain-containing protein [Brachyspira hyodysenteriae]MCZ9870679.1 DUF4234 domain-containing protein [Brachyspira hyodysenteriae]